MSEQHTCCICGAILTAGACLSCRHEQCGKCPVFVPKPRYDELERQVAVLTAERDALSGELRKLTLGAVSLRSRYESLTHGKNSG